MITIYLSFSVEKLTKLLRGYYDVHQRSTGKTFSILDYEIKIVYVILIT